jgi:hypothetical protein
MVRFSALDDLFRSCREHLDEYGIRGTQIENYFVQHILIRICAEFEIRISQLIENRLRTNDPRTLAFARACLRRECKDFNVGDIAGILGKFDVGYKHSFHSRVANTDINVAWDNIYNNRVTVAHKIGTVQLTFVELEATYTKSLELFDALIAALELKPSERKGLI